MDTTSNGFLFSFSMNQRGSDFLGCSHDVQNRNAAQESNFCSRENWQSAALFLSRELEILGFAPPCASVDSGEGNLDVISLVNTTWDLVQSYRTCIKTIAGLEDQMRRIHNDMDHLHEQTSKQKDIMESKNRMIHDLTENKRQAENQLQDAKDKIKTAKDENKRVSGLFQQHEVQYKHELRRKDQEVTKLKERLMRILSDKRFEPAGIEMTCLNKKSEGRAKWRTDANEQQRKSSVYDSVIEDLNLRTEKLEGENAELREHLFNVLFQLASVTAPKETERAKTALMPLDISRETVTDLSSRVVEQVRERLEKDDAGMSAKLKEYEDHLESKDSSMGDESNTKVLNELKKMFRDGKELLRLNQQLQESELAQLEKTKREVLTEKAELASYKKHLLLSASAQEDQVPFDVGCGPSWSWSNSTCTLPFSGGVSTTGYGITIGPQYPKTPGSTTSSRPPSRPHSRPQSRSHSAAREGAVKMRPSPSSVNSGVARRQRPRSTNISPQRRMSMGRMIGGGIRSGSSSPAASLKEDGHPLSPPPGWNSRSLPRPVAARKLSLVASPLASKKYESEDERLSKKEGRKRLLSPGSKSETEKEMGEEEMEKQLVKIREALNGQKT